MAKVSSRAPGLPSNKASEQPLVEALWRRRHIVGWSVLGAFIFACLFLLVAPRSYTSFAELYIVQGQGKVMGQTPADVQRSDDYLNTQCGLITATPVLALALSEEGIGDLEILRNAGERIEYLQKNIVADVEKHRDLISVSLEARDPVETAKLVNAVVQAYVTYQTKIQHSTSAEVLDLLEKEKARDEEAIAVKNQQLATLRDMYGETAYDSSQNNPIIQQETALSNALTAARLDAVNAKAAYDQAMALIGNDQEKLQQIELPDDPGDLVAASPAQLDLLKSEIFRLGQSLKDLERTYLPDHPLVQQASSRLNLLTVTYVRAERQHWLSAKAQQEALQTSFDQQHKVVLNQATQAADFDRVRTEFTRIESDLDVVERRINEVSVNQDAGSLNIQITQPAIPAPKPSFPPKLKTLFGALFFGLLVGCGLAIGREKFPLGAGPMSRVSSELGCPVLGVLPSMDARGTLVEHALQTHLQPASAVAEAARSISRILAESGFDDEIGRTLLVASCNPLEGRTTLLTNLALAMAQSGMKILIVDANHRSPRLHSIFNLRNDFGLFDVLSGRAADRPAIQTTHIENVDLLACGAVPANSVELLNDEMLVDLLGELSDRYDRVLIDSPALGRGVEARILAANCAAAILVTAARPTVRRQIGQGLRLLRSVGANVLGLVINEPGAIDPLKAVGSGLSPARSALPARAFRAVLTTGDED
ncbi:MAG: polysaccharide biosynthesis tyrosine autokinase [Tepidisphaeraceae bacterium]